VERSNASPKLRKGPTAMSQISTILSAALLVEVLFMALPCLGGQGLSAEPCEGPYKDRQPTPEALTAVLSNHQAWIMDGREPYDGRRANLCQADLSDANLQKALLWGTNLQRARLRRANLQEVLLDGANLQEADLSDANLQRATLRGANLQRAQLGGANLQEADLSDANLQEALLMWANLAGVFFEPKPGSLPALWTLTSSRSKLEAMTFRHSPAALVELREAFRNAGLRTQERQIIYALAHSRRLQDWHPTWYYPGSRDERPRLEKLSGKGESLFKYVWFELPVGYGLVPQRALEILGLLILLFSIPYMIALHPFRSAMHAHGRAGIWAIWRADRVHQGEGTCYPSRVTHTFIFPRLQERAAGRWWGAVLRGLCVPLLGLYFSLLSAFSPGWRELDVGIWIARMQPREYTWRATGWVRTVSGVESPLSVYLLVLWVLTYFGRPFE
jgi:hypothetical protein